MGIWRGIEIDQVFNGLHNVTNEAKMLVIKQSIEMRIGISVKCSLFEQLVVVGRDDDVVAKELE
jgi:hypothetical protein